MGHDLKPEVGPIWEQHKTHLDFGIEPIWWTVSDGKIMDPGPKKQSRNHDLKAGHHGLVVRGNSRIDTRRTIHTTCGIHVTTMQSQCEIFCWSLRH